MFHNKTGHPLKFKSLMNPFINQSRMRTMERRTRAGRGSERRRRRSGEGETRTRVRALAPVLVRAQAPDLALGKIMMGFL